MVILWGTSINGKLRSAELLLKEDGSVQMIRRARQNKKIISQHLISAISLMFNSINH